MYNNASAMTIRKSVCVVVWWSFTKTSSYDCFSIGTICCDHQPQTSESFCAIFERHNTFRQQPPHIPLSFSRPHMTAMCAAELCKPRDEPTPEAENIEQEHGTNMISDNNSMLLSDARTMLVNDCPKVGTNEMSKTQTSTRRRKWWYERKLEPKMSDKRQTTLPDSVITSRLGHITDVDHANSSENIVEKCCSTVYGFYNALTGLLDLIWSYVPPKLYLYCCYLTYLFWFFVGILVLRKTQNAIAAVRYVKIHGPSVSETIIEASPQFKDLLWSLDHEFDRPPAIFFLNQYALNMTFNFLCNTRDLEGVHRRLIFITLDSTARDVLKEYWPNVRQLYWPTPSLYRPFSFAEGAYQTLYLLRANLAVCLLKHGKSFWMMQQDTFWRKNLFDLNLEDNYEYDALFDQIGDDQNSERAEWVNEEEAMVDMIFSLNKTEVICDIIQGAATAMGGKGLQSSQLSGMDFFEGIITKE
ncbi:hypothetical protein Tcan_08082 [Toxocara canis]|uniref:Nucleotide-diphospho-sugar transferase domain-containing protein n=2 Tax=Toxocara canis TaxID=6265 RepID=A0A0B2UQU0_TOXCA|nr:hypothetical protein Tcan_08082 [Toxocara canis]